MFSRIEAALTDLGSNARMAAIIALVITSVAFGAYLSLGILTPIYSDGAFFADMVRGIARSGTVLESHPHVMANRDLPFPIFYPQGALVGVAGVSLFVGELAVDLVSALAGAFILLGMYLYSRQILGSRWFALLVPGVIAASFYLVMFAGGRFKPDIILTFLFIAFLYAAAKSVESKSFSWPIVGGIFLAGAIGAKQQGTLFLLLFLAAAIPWLVFHRDTRKSGALKRLGVLVAVALLLASPVLLHQFAVSGTIAYPNNYIEPLSSLETIFADALGIQRWSPNPTFSEFVGGSSFGQIRLQQASSLEGVVGFLNPFNPEWGLIAFGLFLLLAAFGVTEAARRRTFASTSYLILVGLLVLTYVTLIPVPEDMLLLPLLVVPLLVFGLMGFVRLTRLVRPLAGRVTLVIMVALLVAASAVSSLTSYQHFQNTSRVASWRATEFIAAGEWLDTNSPLGTVVLTSRASEVGYFTNRQTIWLNLLDATDLYLDFNFGSETEVIAALRAYNVSYVLVPTWWIGTPDAWIGYMSTRTVGMMESSAAFISAYESEGILLFELRPASPSSGLSGGVH